MATLADRLAAKIDTTTNHHLWLGATGSDGTPQIRVNGTLTTARRVAWELAHGPLPHNQTVAACPDHPRCIRLDHLRIGRTHRTPVRDPQPLPRQRARRGGGSMRELRPDVWELSISSGGTRRYRTLHGTRTDAAAALARFAAKATGQTDTLDALVAAYLAHLENEQRSPATLRRYRQLWRHWLAHDLALTVPRDLSLIQLERPLATMAKAGQSSSSIHQAAVLLSSCLAWAQRQGHLPTNPALGLHLPDGTVLAPPRRR